MTVFHLAVGLCSLEPVYGESWSVEVGSALAANQISWLQLTSTGATSTSTGANKGILIYNLKVAWIASCCMSCLVSPAVCLSCGAIRQHHDPCASCVCALPMMPMPYMLGLRETAAKHLSAAQYRCDKSEKSRSGRNGARMGSLVPVRISSATSFPTIGPRVAPLHSSITGLQALDC